MASAGYRWAVVGMLWLVCLFNYADRQAIFSVFEPIKEEMKLDDVQLGIVGGAFMWVYAAAMPFTGVIGDRVNRKALILGGLVFWSVVTLATGWATEYWQLVLLRALEGLGEAFYFPASMSLISDYHGPATRSRAMGIHQSSVYAGTILGGAVAGYCADRYGWRSGFFLFGGLGFAVAVLLLLGLREPARGAADGQLKSARPAGAADAFRGIGEVLSNRMALLFIAVFVGSNFVASIFLSWMPTYLKRTFGMSLTLSGVNATTWRELSAMLGVVVAGWLADRWARRFRGGRVLVQAAGLIGGAPLIFLTGWTRDIGVLVVAMAGFGFCKGVYDSSIWASLYDVVPAARRATAQGLMNSIGWIGGGIAPVAIAAASERYTMSACLSATSLIYLSVGCLLLAGSVLLRPRPAADPPLPTAKEKEAAS